MAEKNNGQNCTRTDTSIPLLKKVVLKVCINYFLGLFLLKLFLQIHCFVVSESVPVNDCFYSLEKGQTFKY